MGVHEGVDAMWRGIVYLVLAFCAFASGSIVCSFQTTCVGTCATLQQNICTQDSRFFVGKHFLFEVSKDKSGEILSYQFNCSSFVCGDCSVNGTARPFECFSVIPGVYFQLAPAS